MKILALDVATNTGCAVGVSGGTPRSWSYNLGKAPNARRFSNVLRLTHSLIEEHKPDLIAVEGAVGGPKASAYLIGLIACVEGCAFNRGVPCEVVHLGTVRKHFLGKSLTTRHFPHLKPAAAKRAIKAQVIQRCAIMGWQVDGDDEADSLAIWDYACATYARGYQAKPLGELFV